MVGVKSRSQPGPWTDQMSPLIQRAGQYFHLNFEKYFRSTNIFVLIGLQFLLNYLICLELLLQVINLGIIKEIKFGSSCIHTQPKPRE